MALPPATFPEIRGKRCGQEWTATIVVTGQLPGTSFGDQYTHTLQPISNNYPLVISMGGERDEQIVIRDKVEAKIADLRNKLAQASNFTSKEKKQITWLLDRADTYLLHADELWSKWEDREGGTWPLSQGDALSDFYGGICSMSDRGRWITRDIPRGKVQVFCPAPAEPDIRKKDRKAIGKAFNDALAHVYCAEYGYWRLRLYKQAFDAYAEPFGFAPGGEPKEPQPTPGIVLPGDIVAPTKPLDPCKDFGINCPPGDEPEDCPTGLCTDPNDLPDPDVVPPGEQLDPSEEPGPDLGSGPLAPEPPVTPPGVRRDRNPLALAAAGAGTLILTGIAVWAMR